LLGALFLLGAWYSPSPCRGGDLDGNQKPPPNTSITGIERHVGWFVLGDRIHGVLLVQYPRSAVVQFRSSDLDWQEATNLTRTASAWVLIEDGKCLTAKFNAADRTPANVNGTIFYGLFFTNELAASRLRAVVMELSGQLQVFPVTDPVGGVGTEVQVILDRLNSIPLEILGDVEKPDSHPASTLDRRFRALAKVFKEQLLSAGYQPTWSAERRTYSVLKR
jgi:hypothetical protein